MHRYVSRKVQNGAMPVSLVLAHGAGAGQKHPWMQRVARGLDARDIHVVTFDFPYMAAGKRVPDAGPVLEAAYIDEWARTTSGHSGPWFAGGKSMGGRMASQVVAKNGFDPAPLGLVFFGYPLHPPGKPEQRRDKHLSSITAPMLFLHGARDGFGSPEEMQTLVAGLSNAQLEIIAGGDHSLLNSKRSDPEGRSLEHAMDVAARWMKSRI